MATSHPSGRDPLRVVIAGGGVAALEAMIALHATAGGRVDVTLVSASDTFTYRPLAVGEPFGFGHPARHPLSRLCADHDASLLHARVDRVRTDDRQVELDDGSTVDYDRLIVAVGAKPVPAFEYGVTFDRDTSAQDFDDVLADLTDGIAPRIAIIVPDTVSWTLPAYEIAFMTAAWGAARHLAETSVVVVTPEPRPLAAFGAIVSAEIDGILTAAGVMTRCGVHPDLLSHAALRAGGKWVPGDRMVSLPQIAGPRLPGIPCDPGGFVPVDEFGRVRGVEGVYSAGDGTTLPIKQGGLAAQLADVVAAHVVAGLPDARAPEPFRPVLRGLLRTPRGPRYLRAELDDPDATSTISEQPLWWPPSKIASRWLSPYLARIETARLRGERASAATPRGAPFIHHGP
jgi:sulfide:quinone oxidoreductase